MDVNTIIEDFEELRQFTGTPGEFWTRFIEKSTRLIEADCSLLMIKDPASGAWNTLCAWPAGNRLTAQNSPFASLMQKVAESVAVEGSAWKKVGREAGTGLEGTA